MSNPPRIEVITDGSDPRLPALAPLLEAMYAEMAALGPVRPLAPDGARRWLDSIAPGLERFGRLCIAERDGEVLGFAHGALKLLPEHLGGHRIGHVTHVHVAPGARRLGLARQLAQRLEDWFAAKQVDEVEIQLVAGNAPAAAFWESLGYRMELVQYRKRR